MEQERTLPIPTRDELFAFIPPREVPRFIATRYPYTYAYDFLRSHPDIIPSPETYDIILNCATGNGGSGSFSRSDAAQLVRDWCERNDWSAADREILLFRLADAYLREHEIKLP